MKVLVVDDSAVDRLFLSVFLEEIADTDFAKNGEEALAHIERAISNGGNYDLICLDFIMPEMDGPRTLTSIRGLEAASSVQPSKIFMITSCSSPDEMIEVITAGDCDDYIVKPVISEAFFKLLGKHNLLQGTVED
jgi:CheY-like chemotaxis protein